MTANIPVIKVGGDTYGGNYQRAQPVITVDETGAYVAPGSGGGAGGNVTITGQAGPIAVTGASGAPVVVALANSSTSNQARVATSTASAQILAANGSRVQGYTVQNESAAVMYLLEGTGTASPTNYTTQVPAGLAWQNDKWIGRVAAVLASGTGNAMATEYLA